MAQIIMSHGVSRCFGISLAPKPDWHGVKVASTGDITIYVDPDTIRRKGDPVKMGKLLDYETVQDSAGTPR